MVLGKKIKNKKISGVGIIIWREKVICSHVLKYSPDGLKFYIYYFIYVCMYNALNVIYRLPRWFRSKESTCQCRRCQRWSLGQGDPLEEEMAAQSRILVWEIPWAEEPGGPQPQGCKESDMIWRLSTHIIAPHTWTATPLNGQHFISQTLL